MIEPNPAAAGRGPIFEGWYVVASVFVLLMVNAGLGFYGLAVFLRAITDEQGFSTASVSLATSLFFVVSAVAGRLIAPVLGRRDVRQIVAVGALVAALGLLMIGRSTGLAWLYVSYVVFAAGAGLSGLVPATTLVTRWFDAKRSIALSVASTGLSVGGLTVTVVAAQIIDSVGMRGAAPWLALMFVGISAVSLLALWPDPAARGQRPDGVAASAVAPAVDAGQSYEASVRSRFFRLVTAAFVVTMGAQVGGIAQLAKLGSERVDDGTGTLLVSSVALASIFARLVGGVVATRVQLIAMTAVLAAVQAAALAWLAVASSAVPLVVGALVFGCTIGNLLMLQPLLIADRFGVVNYPRLFALSQLIVIGLGVAGGPYLLGFLHDVSSYRVSYLVAMALSALGSLVFAAAWRFAPPVGSDPLRV